MDPAFTGTSITAGVLFLFFTSFYAFGRVSRLRWAMCVAILALWVCALCLYAAAALVQRQPLLRAAVDLIFGGAVGIAFPIITLDLLFNFF